MLDLKDWYAYGTGYKSTVQKTVFNSLLVGNELISTINCVLLIGSKKKKDFGKIQNAAFRSTVQRSIQYLYNHTKPLYNYK